MLGIKLKTLILHDFVNCKTQPTIQGHVKYKGHWCQDHKAKIGKLSFLTDYKKK